ncbi:hypothetical protein ASE73_09775 [Sphingomonas sp. Leaf24]|nr:hypothetical protein ASE50_07825 [Sphingomonas sp. Leaf5]KQM88151.1 hypothetical protein ASE73_09775 [Sphingomonas sp. Leaf24]
MIVDNALSILARDTLHSLANVELLSLESAHPQFVIFDLAIRRLLQRSLQPSKNFGVDIDRRELFTKQLDQCLLANIWVRTFPFRVAAPVVDVLLLFDVADEQAAAMAAMHQPGEQEILLDALNPLRVPAIEDALHSRPKLDRDQRFMRSLIAFAEPFELARIDARAQHLVNRTGPNRLAALAVDHTVEDSLPACLLERIQSGTIPFEQPLDERSHVRIDADYLFTAGADRIPVTDRRHGRPDTLLGLLEHSLARLLRQVVDVVLGHQHLDAVHELLGGPRLLRDDGSFLHQMNVDLDVVDRHPIAKVAV